MFRAVLLFYLWVALEQVIITSILPRWQGDIIGFWQAAAIARGAHSDGQVEYQAILPGNPQQ